MTIAMMTKVRILSLYSNYTDPVLNSCEGVQKNVECFTLKPFSKNKIQSHGVSRDRNRYNHVATVFNAGISRIRHLTDLLVILLADSKANKT